MIAKSEPEETYVEHLSIKVTAPGTSVVAVGNDDDGHEALALWHVNPQGRPTGAWVGKCDDVFSSVDTARRFVTLFERRAVTAMDLGGINETVEKLCAVAGLGAARWWEKQVFSPVRIFQEVIARREAYDATVAAARETGRNTAPLEWSRDFSTAEAPADFENLRLLSGIQTVSSSPVCSEALSVSRVLRWMVSTWAEIEQVKNRRAYVREVHGPVEALPPSWLAAITTADANRPPL